ncbi:MAG: signal peptidase I [Candidatus Omnitrophica bacterium]|nr:signal peptidase I [Candidatus Omnitrophota bacterium]MCK5288904.1 signal peptidase I [Candidatus Omnitrophota bacterium]MCK5394270.1 signal peptidase I [Candidatus Omnitrophota bacterium]
MRAKKSHVVREWVEAFIVAAVIVTILRTFLFQIYKIPTKSMVPTLIPKDKIFVTKLLYGPKVPFTKLRIHGFRKPKRGEVVVFVPPHDRKKVYIKRLVGLPGESVRIKDGNIYVDGKIVVDPGIAKNIYTNQGEYAEEGRLVFIPEGKYFFLGDNSRYSADSRFWGFVDEVDIVGKAIFIWWPFYRVKLIE